MNVDTLDLITTEDMIQRVESQRDDLIKNQKQYKDDDYHFKLSTIDHLLSTLRLKLTSERCDEILDKRVTIDKIISDKRIPEKQFKDKINLTGDRDDKDPNTTLLTGSRAYFKGMTYLPLPSELQEKDPKYNKIWGNKPIPDNMLKMINFS